MFEDKEDEQSIRQLEKLEQLYTLGEVNFDSVIIIDFGNNLKSVLTSLVYTDVNQKKFYLLQLINGLMKVFFTKIQLKIFIIHQLIMMSLKNIMIITLKSLINTQRNYYFNI